MTWGPQACESLPEMGPMPGASSAESASRFCDGCGNANRLSARFCGSCGTDLPDAGVTSPLARARTLCARGEPLQALNVVEAAVEAEVADDALRLAYATLLLQAGDYESGLAHLGLLSAVAEQTPVVQAYVGGALLGLRRVSEAKDVLDAAFARWPSDFYVLLKRGELYCRLGVYQTAARALEQANSSVDVDPVAREMLRRLLRFAREKNRSGFVRSFPARVAGRWTIPWLAARKPHSDAAWGT